jgi:hypothetical protein
LFLYVCAGMQLFDPEDMERAEYFPSLQEGMWTLVMTMNSSNWPDPFLIAYKVR